MQYLRRPPPTGPVYRNELGAGVSYPPSIVETDGARGLERIPLTMSTAPAAMPIRAAPTSTVIPAKARIPMSSTKRAMPTGPSRVIWMRILWCAPVDPQIREARGRSAPGGMTQKEYRSAVIAVSKSVGRGL